MHLLGGTPEPEEEGDPAQYSGKAGGLESRVLKLEQELAELKEAFDKLMKELMG